MNRQPASLAIAMSYRPYLRGNRPQRGRRYSGRPSDPEPEFVSGDSHYHAVRNANRGFRPAYNAVPPPPLYFGGQQSYGPRPGPPNSQQFPGPGPHWQPRQVGPAYGNNQHFRPRQMQQEFRPRASKPPDYREWEYAASPPPPDCGTL